MKRTLLCSVCVLLMLAALPAFAAGKSTDTVKFGVNYELTGDFPIIGSSAEEGIKLAVDEINAAGGVAVGGKKYKLSAVFLDNAFKEAESAVVTQKFADDDSILGIVGPNDSAMCLAAAQIVNDAHLPTITPWATNVDITKTGKYFFRACFTDDFQGAILAKYAYQTAGAKTAASLYDKSNPYNVGVASQFEKTFKELGGKVVESQTYNHGDTDFSAQLTKITSKKADILILPNFYEEVVNQATQARKLGYNGKFIGSDTWGDTSLLTADTEHLLNNAVCIGHYHVDIATDKARAFIASYKKKYGTDKVPNDIVALNYDSVYLFKTGLENAGVLNRDAVQKGLASIKVYDGVTGKMEFGGPIVGNPKKTAVMIQIRNGKFEFLKIEKPLDK
jgi:branched-chain amino acid transport system substrate-binding protein